MVSRLVLLSCWLFSSHVLAEPVDYRRDVKPILMSRCAACHGALQQKAGLRLDASELIRKGGKNGPVIAVGKSAESSLLDAVLGKDRSRMPPEKDGAALTEKQIGLLRAWIDQGAKMPEEAIPADPRKHWAFQPPKKSETRDHQSESQNPIDLFIVSRLQQHSLSLNSEASRETLLRRLSLDLTGLPPTPEELREVRNDQQEGWYERLVDRLLASPRHGERWARHWMDVWRYSDWYGRRSVNDVRNSAPQIYRWRDWIVSSLNADHGYDRMVQHMLAGDEIAPENDAARDATGFLVRNWYALNPNEWMRDTVEHTGKAFLGLTFNCAHCHDHKYDPISHEEYFRFRAFFEPMGLRQDRVLGEADPGPFEKYDYAKSRKIVKTGAVRVFDENPLAKTLLYNLGDERDFMKDKPPATPGAPAFLGGDRLNIVPIDLPAKVVNPALREDFRQEDRKRLEAIIGSTAMLEVKAFLDARPPKGPTYPKTSTGRRKALALWITSRDNPLTARVAINHLWKHYFGRPLVETVADLGRNGARPTHPALLDWLAVELMDNGWSMKHIHRLIVTSRTYRQSGVAKSQAVDPDNKMLWRFPSRRLEAEAVRDSVLFVAGQLDTTMGGPPLDNVADANSRRRSLYFTVYPEDGGHHRFLELFDPPDPCDCYKRTASIVPQQALAMTNSKLLLDHGRLLARSLVVSSDDAFLVAAYERVLSRSPSPHEKALCLTFLKRQEELYRVTKAQPVTSSDSAIAPSADPRMRARESLVRALFNHDDFLTIR